jgi:hypothetical protein
LSRRQWDQSNEYVIPDAESAQDAQEAVPLPEMDYRSLLPVTGRFPYLRLQVNYACYRNVKMGISWQDICLLFFPYEVVISSLSPDVVLQLHF